MATIKVKREVVLEKMRVRLAEVTEVIKDVATKDDIDSALRQAQSNAEHWAREIERATANLKQAKADVKSLESTRPALKVVRKYVWRQSSGYGQYGIETLRKEIRLLELSDEEFIRVGTTSNIAQYL